MGPESVGTPWDVIEERRKRNVKEIQSKFFNNLGKKRKHNKNRKRR